MSESASLHEKLTVTGWLTQLPGTYGMPPANVAVALICGGVRSTLIPSTVALAEFPARSVATPATLWLLPSPTVSASGQTLMPEVASMQVNVTTTLVLFQ